MSNRATGASASRPEDDGRGMTPAPGHRGLGLLTMARRAETIGADIKFDSVPGGGTTVTCSLALEDE